MNRSPLGWICSMTVGTMEKERRTRGGRHLCHRLQASFVETQNWFNARPARFTRSGKISRLRLPNCVLRVCRFFFFFFFSFVLLSSNSAFRLLLFSLDVHVSRPSDDSFLALAEVLIKKRASLPIKMGKNNYSFSIFFFLVVSFFFISPLFCFFFLFFFWSLIPLLLPFHLRYVRLRRFVKRQLL